MVCLSTLQEDRARSAAGMDRNNVIVNPAFLRKELLKIYYVKDVNIIMGIIGSCDMKKPESKKAKTAKSLKDLDNAVITCECSFEDFKRNEKPIH